MNEDVAGCGGVLRDAGGVARALFLCPTLAKDSNAVETGAVITALPWGGKVKGLLLLKRDLMWCLLVTK